MVQYTLNINEEKKDLVDDLAICRRHIERLRELCNLPRDDKRIAALKAERESLDEQCSKIFIKWKEEWRIVLQFVPDFMSIVLDILGHVTTSSSEPYDPTGDIIFAMVMEFLRNLILCISAKRIARYWPTDVTWLPRVVTWLEIALKNKYRNDTWSCRYVLLLWLSCAVRTPFDLSRFDQNRTDSAESPKMSQRVDDIIRETITDFALVSVVHLLAVAFYSRADILRIDSENPLKQFIAKLTLRLGFVDDPRTIGEQVCSLRSLATLLAGVDREAMRPFVDDIIRATHRLVNSSHELLTKLSVKVMGRAILTRIKPRLFKWRYSCGSRITATMDEAQKEEEEEEEEMNQKKSANKPETIDKVEDSITKLVSTDEQAKIEEKEDDEDEDEQLLDEELPENFEETIQIFLRQISNASSDVRFSVAKYLATICARLPYRFSDEILEYIVEQLCTPTQDDQAWHGGCLALAEFVRRGYVRVDRMTRVIDVAERALFYEHIKGSFALGTHVRDAAAYICWSMARAYDSRCISPFVDRLAPALINVACFDRQLNCRRAASAVIQELAGRTQRFPHWIDAIERTEFHRLSMVDYTFTELGVHFAQYDEFRDAIIRNLMERQIVHWNAQIRRLAAQTFGLISRKYDIPIIADCGAKLLDRSAEPDLNVRHGSILAIAYLIESLILRSSAESSGNYLTIISPRICSLIDDLNERNCFAGMGGDFMRESCSLVIAKYCAEKRRFNESWANFLRETIENCKTDSVREPLIAAIVAFVGSFSNNNLDDENVDGRQFLRKILLPIFARHDQCYAISTVSLALRQIQNLPQDIGAEFALEILHFIEQTFDSPVRRSVTIADAIRVLISLASDLMITDSHSQYLNDQNRTRIVALFIRCLDDHTIDKQGDVGSLVRIAAIECLLDRNFPGDAGKGNFFANLAPEQLLRIVQLTASEAIYRRMKSFSIATEALSCIAKCFGAKLAEVLPSECVRMLTELSDQNDENSNQNNQEDDQDLEQYRRLIRLLEFEPLAYDLWSGIVCIAADPLLERYAKSIFAYLVHDRAISSETRHRILDEFLRLFADCVKHSRLAIPCLITGKKLLQNVSCASEFQRRLPPLCWSACGDSLNPKKYLLACDVFCAMIAIVPEQSEERKSSDEPEDLQSSISNSIWRNLSRSYAYVHVLLAHRLPRVRRYAADELFTALLSLDDDDDESGGDEERRTGLIEQIGEILQQTDWLVIGDARQARDRIRSLIKQLTQN